MLYSDELKPYIGPLTAAVQQAVADVQQYFKVTDLKVLSFDSWHIVVPVKYKVSLPANGAVNDIDIRPAENMLIYISLEDYPNYVPFILSDRKDFPKNRLSHLYFTEQNKPARLCLVRDSPFEWFATIKMSDFLDVGGQWLYKAATGQLNGDGNEFDPTRLEGNINGRHIYKYDLLHEVVSKNQRLNPDYPMAVFVAGQFFNKARRIAYKTLRPVPLIALSTVTTVVQEVYAKEKEGADRSINPMFSFLTWHPDDKIEELYLTSLPKNFGELKLFFGIRGITITPLLKAMEEQGTLIKCGIPIIYAMKRPLKMIGYNGNYEFFNFLLTMPKEGIAALTDGATVSVQGHTEPFSPELASYISGQLTGESTLFVGAGSLGSKLIMHESRNGNLNIGVADNDDFALHNLVRHELFAEHVGLNKAKAITDVVKKFYAVDSTDNIKAYDISIVLMNEELQGYRYLVDSTASIQVRNYLVLHELPMNLYYTKTEIAYSGQLGLLYAEGPDRNPRMDDLTNYACFLGTKDHWIEEWRGYDMEQTKENLNIGLGCSSATVVMPDDVISFHAAIFSRYFVEKIKGAEKKEAGLLYMSSLRQSAIATREYQVAPLEILECQAGSAWQLRLLAGTKGRLIDLCHQYKPIETGGVLIGVANYKTKVIHVFDILTESQDSHGTCVGFTRGIKGLPEEIDSIKKKTGNVIGYIGEWHSHPMNLKRLSNRDHETIAELKIFNKQIPIPTCAIIVTQDQVLAFVYE